MPRGRSQNPGKHRVGRQAAQAPQLKNSAPGRAGQDTPAGGRQRSGSQWGRGFRRSTTEAGEGRRPSGGQQQQNVSKRPPRASTGSVGPACTDATASPGYSAAESLSPERHAAALQRRVQELEEEVQRLTRGGGDGRGHAPSADVEEQVRRLEAELAAEVAKNVALDRRNGRLQSELRELDAEVEEVAAQRDSLRACVDGIDALLKKVAAEDGQDGAGIALGLLTNAFSQNNLSAAVMSTPRMTPRDRLVTPREPIRDPQLGKLQDELAQLQERYTALYDRHRCVEEENKSLNSSISELRMLKAKSDSDLSRVLEDYNRLRQRSAATPDTDDITTEADSSPVTRGGSAVSETYSQREEPARPTGFLRFFGRS